MYVCKGDEKERDTLSKERGKRGKRREREREKERPEQMLYFSGVSFPLWPGVMEG